MAPSQLTKTKDMAKFLPRSPQCLLGTSESTGPFVPYRVAQKKKRKKKVKSRIRCGRNKYASK